MTMDADTAHRFWLGKVNVTVALARGQMKAKGPVAKILKLVPLVKPVFPRYRQMLEEAGRAGPARGLVEADRRSTAPLRGFKDFYQYASPTRVIAGRDLLESTGFEFMKEGAERVLDRHRRGDPRHRPGRPGRGGRHRRRPRGGRRVRRRAAGLVHRRRGALRRGGQGGGRGLLPRRGRRLGDGHRQGGRRRVHPRRQRARAGGLLPDAAREPTAWAGRSRWPRWPASRPRRAPAARCRWPR